MVKKNKKQVLGRGLSALLDDPEREINSPSNDNSDELVGKVIDLEIDKIEVNPYQPRTQFREEAIGELAESIKTLGIIQPVTVRKLGRNQYQLVSGERRYRASKSIGLKTIPAFVRVANDQETLEMALVENIQRKNLDPIEVALSYQRLIEEIQLTQEELSVRVGKKRSTVTNYLRLLKLPPDIQVGLRDGLLSMGHARALIGVPDAVNKANEIIEKKLSVRQVEKLVSKFKKNKPNKSSKDPNIVDLEKELSDKIGLKTSIQFNESGSSGSLTLYYSDLNQLDDLMKRLKK